MKKQGVQEVIVTKPNQQSSLGIIIALETPPATAATTATGTASKSFPVIRRIDENGLFAKALAASGQVMMDKPRLLSIDGVACQQHQEDDSTLALVDQIEKAPAGQPLKIILGPHHMVAATVKKTNLKERVGIVMSRRTKTQVHTVEEEQRTPSLGIFLSNVEGKFALTELKPGMKLYSMNDTKITPQTTLKDLLTIIQTSLQVTIIAEPPLDAPKSRRSLMADHSASSSHFSQRTSFRDILLGGGSQREVMQESLRKNNVRRSSLRDMEVPKNHTDS